MRVVVCLKVARAKVARSFDASTKSCLGLVLNPGSYVKSQRLKVAKAKVARSFDPSIKSSLDLVLIPHNYLNSQLKSLSIIVAVFIKFWSVSNKIKIVYNTL